MSRHALDKVTHVGILTVIPPELKAVMLALGFFSKPEKQDNGTVYWRGQIRSKLTQRSYRITLGCIGSAGNYDSASAASEMLQSERPQILVLLGIAAGMRGKTKIGNVIFSERVVAYEGAAIEQGREIGRPEIVRPDHSIEQDVVAYIASYSAERATQAYEQIGTFPMALKGDREIASIIDAKSSTIASGEKLLRDPTKLRLLRTGRHGKIEVGEMEAAGLFTACRRWNTPWLVVRGISDFGDKRKTANYHDFSAKAAATVLRDFLVHGLHLSAPRPNSSDPEMQRQAALIEKAAQRSSQALNRVRASDILRRYCQMTLDACDIIDLAGLPEDDRHLALQKLLLRQCYIPLRFHPSNETGGTLPSLWLDTLEQMRDRTREVSSGRVVNETNAPSLSPPVSIGRQLGASSRIIILGDPGTGKTTFLRWLATAYLLRASNDVGLASFPDAKMLPDRDWLPIIIRCRDLELIGPLDDLLKQTLRKAELSIKEIESLQSVLRAKLIKGEAILLIDGLDEVLDPKIRGQLCRQIEAMALAYKNSPIVVTSRIVGYREIGTRLGRGFEHFGIAELSREDRLQFARQWCLLTEPANRREKAMADLVGEILSSRRIYDLAGSPMLLTTMALVKRRIGRLPARRSELYGEAVQVLLNWRSEVDEPLDKREALPQLEFLAFIYCRSKKQRMTEDEALAAINEFRNSHPNLRAVHTRSAEEFLRLVERRTSIVVQTGVVRKQHDLLPVYEFRHLTFQDYLAGIGVLRGHIPGNPISSTIVDRVKPLIIEAVRARKAQTASEAVLDDNWQEAIRVCVSCCDDNEVDALLSAMLSDERDPVISRRRAILATLCIADEPDVSDRVAQQVLDRFVDTTVPYSDRATVDRVCTEIGRSIWASSFRVRMLRKFLEAPAEERSSWGSMYFIAGIAQEEAIVGDGFGNWLKNIHDELQSNNTAQIVGTALDLTGFYWRRTEIRQNLPIFKSIVRGLVNAFSRSTAAAHAAGWALYFMAPRRTLSPSWRPDEFYRRQILRAIRHPNCVGRALWYIGMFLEDFPDQRAIQALKRRTADRSGAGSGAAIRALGSIGGVVAERHLCQLLRNRRSDTRVASVGALATLHHEPRRRRAILSRRLDGQHPWIDIAEPIGEKRIQETSVKLSISEKIARRLYEEIANRYCLRLLGSNTTLRPEKLARKRPASP